MPPFKLPTNDFLKREVLAENEPVKQPIRKRIAEFFASYQSPNRRPRCFSLPGIRWAFERELADHLDRPAEYIAVEQRLSFLEAGLGYMPGRYHIEHEEITRAHHFKGYRTDQSTIFHCDASTLIDLGRTWKMDNRQAKTWSRLYKGWTCAWLDFQSPINTEIIRCCKSLENNLDRHHPVVPVAVTFMLGREDPETFALMNLLDKDGSALSKRVTFLLALWESHRFRKAELVDAWQYKSVNGGHMAVMTALLRPDHRNKNS